MRLLFLFLDNFIPLMSEFISISENKKSLIFCFHIDEDNFGVQVVCCICASIGGKRRSLMACFNIVHHFTLVLPVSQ